MGLLSADDAVKLAKDAWKGFAAGDQKWNDAVNGPSFSVKRNPSANDCEWYYGLPAGDYVAHKDLQDVCSQWKQFSGWNSPLKEKHGTTGEFEINLLGKATVDWYQGKRYYHFNFHLRFAAETVPMKVAAASGSLSTNWMDANFPALSTKHV